MSESQQRHRERRILDAADLARCLTRLAHELVERNRDVDQVVLVGIRTRGVPLARRLQQAVREITGTEPPLGILDISLYRDDLSRVASSPVVGRTEIDFLSKTASWSWSTMCCTPDAPPAPPSMR